jgi:hypothetical protein
MESGGGGGTLELYAALSAAASEVKHKTTVEQRTANSRLNLRVRCDGNSEIPSEHKRPFGRSGIGFLRNGVIFI